MLATTSSTSNAQLFVDNFEQIVKEMKVTVYDNPSYTAYETPLAAKEVADSALIILNAMKEHFEREPTSSKVSIEGSRFNNFYSYHLRPLYKIFLKYGFSINFEEEVAPYCALPIRSWNGYLVSQSYYTANFSVTFQDTFKDASFLKA